MPFDKNDIILTGIPRSGTTLACTLLNECINTIALVEPIDMRELMGCQTKEGRLLYIENFFAKAREMIVRENVVPIKSLSGEDSNTFRSIVGHRGRSSAIVEQRIQQVAKNLQDNFSLVLKHPNAFAALLPELTSKWRCYAIVRNPIAVLGSWNSLDHPLSQGHAPMAEEFDPELTVRLNNISDVFERQIKLLDWYYLRFHKYLRRGRVIRYEDIVASDGGMLLSTMGVEQTSIVKLVNRNNNKLYDQRLLNELRIRLQSAPDHAAFAFYHIDELM